jgi:hypothetical protein
MKIPTPQYRCPSVGCSLRPPTWTPSSNAAGATSTSSSCPRRRTAGLSIERELVRRSANASTEEETPWLTVDDGRLRTWPHASRRRPAPDGAATRRVQGYFNCWPAFVRKEWEGFAADEKVYRPFPPTPEAIDRMLETMRWVQWLEVEQRHLVWMRAKRYGWRDITIRFACDRTTAWRRWQRALQIVADQMLNGACAHSVVF